MMKKVILCAVILLACVQSCHAYTWGRSKPKANNGSDYDELSAKFHGYGRIIDKLYGEYSGWVIPLADDYGIAPLLALDRAESPDVVLPVLSKYADVFADIYDALKDNPLPAGTKADTALSLLLAFNITDDDMNARYIEAVRSARLKDSRTYYTGRKANYYARQIPGTNIMPGSFFDVLKREHPDMYSRLLHELAAADYDTLKACATYPDAVAFLLNTGRDGVRLIEDTGGQAVMLSRLLSAEEQKRLPAVFRQYHGLAEAVNYCGADVFQCVMKCPELYFRLTDMLYGTSRERHIMAYAVMMRQMQDYAGLSGTDCRRLAYYAAELMNLPDGDENFSGSSMTPLNEAMFFRFALRYGDDAVEACKNYSALLDVSELFMSAWNGEGQDVTPVLDAVRDFGNMGLQAAIYFRLMPDTQRFILNYPEIQKRKILLMFMFYDEICSHYYTQNIGDRNNAAKWLFDNYYPDAMTGRPVPLDKADYIPFKDIISPVYNYIFYGKTPTVYEVLQGVQDLIEYIPALKAITEITENIIFAAGVVNDVLLEYERANAYEAVNSVMVMTPEDMKKQLHSFFHDTGKRSAVMLSEVYSMQKAEPLALGTISSAGMEALTVYLSEE